MTNDKNSNKMYVQTLADIVGLNYVTVKTYLEGWALCKWLIKGSSPLAVKSTIEFWEDFRFYLENRLRKGKIREESIKRCDRQILKLYRKEGSRMKSVAG